MISLIEPPDKTVLGFDIPPKHVVIVSVYLEEGLEFVNIVLQGENSLKMTHAAKLLLGLEKHQPILGTQQLETVAEGQSL